MTSAARAATSDAARGRLARGVDGEVVEGADSRPLGAGLLDRLVGLSAGLREAGVAVSTAEVVDAARALSEVEPLSREQWRAALAATACKRPAWRPAFDALFDLWFPPALGEGVDPEPSVADDAAVLGRSGPVADDPEARDALRAALLEALRDGDDEALRRLARAAVARFGRADVQPGRQSFFSYRALRAANPTTLTSPLLDGLLAGQERGGLAEAVARQTVAERQRRFQQMVEAEVRRRVAEERGAEAVARTAVPELLETVDFLRASRPQMAALRREVWPLARRLATRLTARRTGDRGRLDVRRTVRASLGSGGVPLDVWHKPRKPHKPELVVLCDVSGSVASFAHFTLLLTHALRDQFTKVRAFAFVDTTDEVTRFLEPGGDVATGLARMAAEADVVGHDGHSDYGHAFEVFVQRWPDAVGPRTSLLVLGDARTNFRSPGTRHLRQLATTARHAYWLNPEPRSQWGSGDSVAATYADVVDEMVECRTVEQLAAFVERVLPG